MWLGHENIILYGFIGIFVYSMYCYVIQPDQWEEYYQQKYCTKPPGESHSSSILRFITLYRYCMYVLTVCSLLVAVLVTGECPRGQSSPQRHWPSLNQREDESKTLKNQVSAFNNIECDS